jgi:hypothetical protein
MSARMTPIETIRDYASLVNAPMLRSAIESYAAACERGEERADRDGALVRASQADYHNATAPVYSGWHADLAALYAELADMLPAAKDDK